MAHVLLLPPPCPSSRRQQSSSAAASPDPRRIGCDDTSWSSLIRSLNSDGRFSCLFSDNRKQEEARKALESALGGKKTEFEKWDKEIKRREEAGGGGDAGGGGWSRWGRWFGWSDGDSFWQEAQQTSLTILAIVAMYLIIAKGDMMLAVVLNPLLFLLRGTRNGFTYVTTQILRKVSPSTHAYFERARNEEAHAPVSAKERVVRKWGSD